MSLVHAQLLSVVALGRDERTATRKSMGAIHNLPLR